MIQKNINTIKINKANRKRSKIIAVMIVIIAFVTLINPSVSAVTMNEWNLITSQLDRSYFYMGGTSLSSSWDVSKQNAWIGAYDLSSTMNRYIVSNSSSDNLVMQMDYLYKNGYSGQAVSYGNRWNTLWWEIGNLVTDTKQICSSGSRAEAQNLYNQIQDAKVQLTQLAGEVTQSYGVVQSVTDTPDIGKILGMSSFELAKTLWDSLGKILQTIGTNAVKTDSFLGISWTTADIQKVVDVVSGVIKTFAYAIACILFGINVTTTSLQYEILTLRGGVKVFARVLLVKIWIDLAIPICFYVLNMINSLARQIFNLFTTNSNLGFNSGNLVTVNTHTGNGFVDAIMAVGQFIINFLMNAIYQLPMIAIMTVLCIAIISVFIKIISRAFELTALIAISPVFFATLVGDETKHYFKKFLSAFLSTAGYIVFMAIVYAVASSWIAQCTSSTNASNITNAIISVLPKTLIIIACCRLMRKPPKVLTSLFD